VRCTCSNPRPVRAGQGRSGPVRVVVLPVVLTNHRSGPGRSPGVVAAPSPRGIDGGTDRRPVGWNRSANGTGGNSRARSRASHRRSTFSGSAAWHQRAPAGVGDRRPGLCLLNRRSDLPEDLPVTLGQPGQQLRLGMSGHRGILTWPGGSWYASVSGQRPARADGIGRRSRRREPLGRLATPDTLQQGSDLAAQDRVRLAAFGAAAGDGPGPGHRRQLPGGVPLGQRWAHLVVHLPGRPGRRILQGAGGRAGFSTRPPSRVWPGSPSVGRGAACDSGARAAPPVRRLITGGWTALPTDPTSG
jgi:hypothetical protein